MIYNNTIILLLTSFLYYILTRRRTLGISLFIIDFLVILINSNIQLFYIVPIVNLLKLLMILILFKNNKTYIITCLFVQLYINTFALPITTLYIPLELITINLIIEFIIFYFIIISINNKLKNIDFSQLSNKVIIAIVFINILILFLISIINTIKHNTIIVLLLLIFVVALTVITTLYTYNSYIKVQNIDLLSAISDTEALVQALEENNKGKELDIVENNMLIHEFKTHLQMLYLLNENNSNNEISKYLEQSVDKITSSKNSFIYDNKIIESIINFKIIEANNKNIEFKYIIQDNLSFDFIESYDLNSLISNILNNAIENVSCKDRTIDFIITKKNNILLIESKNTYDFIFKDLKTSKLDKKRHGYGIKNIKKIVSKYNGFLSMSAKNNIFKMTISIPYPQQ